MDKKVITTDKAPAAIGPYSQAIAIQNLLFISGQLPIDPATGQMLTGNIAEKTDKILHNAAHIAQEAGLTLSNVVKTTIFLTDLADFAEMNGAYEQHFPASPPARSTVQVAALPLGSNIEIEFILAR